jgi:hypothetical protein
MKTAMQELIEHLNHVKEFNQMIPGIIKGAEKLLEKEKEQTIDFAYGCVQHISREDIEEYYNKTYNK